ncbi:serine hydrolase [Streptomyces sp. NPDC053499]|uniref:serine hydrolase n=1 Tax=Streptomyces sp. NPDC053499 TaxID=3365707 RepID=UPI0037D2A9AF
MRKSRGLTHTDPSGGPGAPRRRARRLRRWGALALPATVLAGGTAAGTLAAADGAAATTAHARVGGSQVTCSSDDAGLADRLSRRMATALRERHSSTAVALYDRSSDTSCTYRAHSRYDSASVVKATLLGALLRQAEEDHHRKLTPVEKKRATAMITKSDNDSTTALWREVSRGGVQHFLDLAHMRDTDPGRHGYWGLTQITARDEVKLLKLLTSRNRVLDAKSRAYALCLMNKVDDGQRWGTPAGAPKDATVHVKNGWLSRAEHGWRVNSVGAFTGSGHDYGIAVLSQDNKTMERGIETVEAASRAIHRELGATGTH